MRALALSALILAVGAGAQTPPRRQIIQDLKLDAVTEDFPGVFRLRVGPHGQIAVFVSQDQSLRLYDSTGRKIASFGRKGAGPGESRAVNAISFKGDTAWLYDNALKRLTFVTPGGKLLRHEVLPADLNLGASLDSSTNALGAMYRFSPVMIAPNGQLVGYADVVVGRDETGRVKTEQSFLLANVDGSRRKKIGSYVKAPRPTQVSVPIDEKRDATAGIPFLTYPGMVYSQDGTRFGALTTTLTDRGGSYSVTVVRTTGDTLFSRNYPFVGTPIPAAVRDSAIDAIPRRKLANGTFVYEPKIGARLREAAAPLTPRVYRPVENMILGQDNTTWLQMRPVGDSKELIALNAKGDPILSVRIPLNADVWEASPTKLWVVEKDADDLPSVVRYRIRKP
jgi:hypothetical protein